MKIELKKLIEEAETALSQLEGFCAENGIEETFDINEIKEKLDYWKTSRGLKKLKTYSDGEGRRFTVPE